MKIRQLQVERFGSWRDVTVPLSPNALTVLYGPNETGKSTLVRFIRSVLYGYVPQDMQTLGARPRVAGCAGELVVVDGADEIVVRRDSATGDDAQLRRRAALAGGSLPTLATLVGGISRDVYERVFAVGLAELQELATLQGDETSRFIYELSLGDDGERILQLLRQAEATRENLLGTATGSGKLPQCRQVLADIDAQLAAATGAEERHAELEQERSTIAERIENQQWRQSGLREQLRGHAFLERVWAPWQRHRRLHQEFRSLPDCKNFPTDGAEQLAALESGITALRQESQRLRSTHQSLRTEWQQSDGASDLQQHAPEIRALLRSFDALRSVETSLPGLRTAAEAARRQLDSALRQLGPGWSEARLEKVDPGPGTAVKLFRQADRYRAAARSRARCIRAYRRMSALLQQRQSEQAALLRPYAGDGIRDAQQQVRNELEDLDNLRRLESQHQAGTRLLAELRTEGAAASERQGLPPHFQRSMAVLAFAGLALAVAGAWRFATGGEVHAAIVGAIFVLLGVCCGGLTWSIKQHLERESGDDSRWRRRESEVQSELARLDREMQRLVQQPDLMPDDDEDGGLRIAGRDGISDTSDPDEIAERFETLIDQLTELGTAGERETELQERRRRLSNMRERIRLLQRAVSQSRRDWCVALKDAGLDESVRVTGALEVWQTALEARRQQIAFREAQAAVLSAEETWRNFTSRVAAVAQQLAPDQQAVGRPLDLLNQWRARLEILTASDARRSALKQELLSVRNARRSARRNMRHQIAARRNLLFRAGAKDRADFLRLDAAWRRKQELQGLLEEGAVELSEAAATEPELAIVEDDLLRYDGAANREAIATLERELSDLEADLQADHVQVGRVEQELADLEADARPAELRYERAQAESELHRVIRELSAVELAIRAVEALRTRLESERQPDTLRAAGRYLQSLTAGKYQRVWAPLGEQSLVIDDDRRQSFRVDQLSSGTREQLFLSIRLALIDEFVRRGVELPIVFDDLFVNFDQQRTEAAVRTVMDYASDGRQVLLLTCHQHLVRLFEAAGATTVRLPEQELVHDRRRVG